MKKNYYEAHITLEKIDREIEEETIKELGWKFSCIDGDPLLGKKPFSYATKHFSPRLRQSKVINEIESIADSLASLGFIVLRSKLELVLWDTKNA